jgi:hypothetical protein
MPKRALASFWERSKKALTLTSKEQKILRRVAGLKVTWPYIIVIIIIHSTSNNVGKMIITKNKTGPCSSIF